MVTTKTKNAANRETKSAARITAEEFDRLFDEGVDMIEYLDLGSARRPNRERQAAVDARSAKSARRVAIASSAVLALGALVFVLWY